STSQENIVCGISIYFIAFSLVSKRVDVIGIAICLFRKSVFGLVFQQTHWRIHRRLFRNGATSNRSINLFRMYHFMEIYVVRHTKVAVNKGICYGQTDVALADSFQEELAVLKNHLPNDFDQLFSSPLSRCKTLAEPFSSEIIFDDRLKEMHFGDWEMKTWNDIPTDEIQPDR